jgi:hypothetical protein
MNTAPQSTLIATRWFITLLLLLATAGPALATGGGDDAPCDCAQLNEELALADQAEAIELRREDRPMSNLLQAFHNAMNYLYQPAMPDQKAIAAQRERERCREICREKLSR